LAADCAMLFDPKKPITKCPDCGSDTDFLVSQLTRRVFLSTLLERSFFHCLNCGRVTYEIVLLEKEFIRFEAA
jgi:uncharacterized Zn finger protein